MRCIQIGRLSVSFGRNILDGIDENYNTKLTAPVLQYIRQMIENMREMQIIYGLIINSQRERERENGTKCDMERPIQCGMINVKCKIMAFFVVFILLRLLYGSVG